MPKVLRKGLRLGRALQAKGTAVEKERGRRSLLCSRGRKNGRAAEIPRAGCVGKSQEIRIEKWCPIGHGKRLVFYPVCGGKSWASYNCYCQIHPNNTTPAAKWSMDQWR